MLKIEKKKESKDKSRPTEEKRKYKGKQAKGGRRCGYKHLALLLVN